MANEPPSDPWFALDSDGLPVPTEAWWNGPGRADEPPSDSDHEMDVTQAAIAKFYEHQRALVLCTDPDCSVAWAYRDPPTWHYHPKPHGPERPWTEYDRVQWLHDHLSPEAADALSRLITEDDADEHPPTA